MLRKSFTFLVVGCVVLAMAASVSAGIVGVSTLIKDPGGSPPVLFANSPAGTTYSSLASPWVSYRLSVNATGADLIQAVTASVNGSVHQGWSSSNGDGTFDTQTGNSTNATNGDSHFLATANMLFADGPHEDNTLAGSPLTSDLNNGYGLGTSMSATFGPPGAGLTTMNLVYLVVKKGTEPSVNLNFQIFNPTGDKIATLTNADFGAPWAAGGNAPLIADQVINGVKANDLNPANNPVKTTMTATGDPTIAWSGFAFDSFTQAFGGPASATPAVAATFDNNTQQFSWLTNGSPRGTYKWHFTATNAAGSDQGFLTINVQSVPEPASLTLLGLSAIGLVGYARRRGC
jgi:hypothetical protein